MLARVLSGAVLGIEAYLVTVEADVASGLPSFSTVGLPHGAVKEGRERVVAALQNSGHSVPPKRITVNLAPADVKKEGSAFDLPIAVGILAGSGQIEAGRLERTALVGELGLDGGLRPVRGTLSIALAARDAGLRAVVVPAANLAEAAVVDGIEVLGAESLNAVVAHLDGGPRLATAPSAAGEAFEVGGDAGVDFAEVRGQEHAKRALEVAAAGGHNVLMVGPPGSGKTMLARRLPTILPPLSLVEALEVTRIHSVAGLLETGGGLVTGRPFRAPHHTISDAGLIGGGSPPGPGEISLAHHGVLFLDELPEFRRNVLEALRQPLEDFEVTIARAGLRLTFPARPVLVAASNPCSCGNWGDPHRDCTCAPESIERYLGRISGPVLDRIDIHLEVPAVPYHHLADRRPGEASAEILGRVRNARARQRERFGAHDGVHANAHMGPRQIREFCRVGQAGDALLKTAITRLGLSARAYHRVLKIARTLADMDACDDVQSRHVAEAIQYRTFDRPVR